MQQFALNMKVNIKQKKNNFNNNNFMKQIKQKNVNADKGNDSKSYKMNSGLKSQKYFSNYFMRFFFKMKKI